MESNQLINDDCFNILPNIPDESVDCIISDMPYNLTACLFDKRIIDLDKLWIEYKRITKPNAAVVLFASQPFTTKLIASNLNMFKYELIWEKEQGSMPMNAPFQPIKVHESIIIFSKMAATYSKKGTMKYNPQKTIGEPYKANNRKQGNLTFHSDPSGDHFKDNKGDRYPRSVLKFKTERGYHPTQKPIELIEYLVKTYSNKDETVLDTFAGSSTLAIACLKNNRRYICIEKDSDYYNISLNRINNFKGDEHDQME